jgi:hypothetical protein
VNTRLSLFRFGENDLVWPHHVVIFVLQHVAVKDIAACVAFESHDDGEHIGS